MIGPIEMARQEYYRGLCDNPSQYDKVINWIRDNNPSAKISPLAVGNSPEEKAEDFASNAVNMCIRGVVFGESTFTSTGMCQATRVRDHAWIDEEMGTHRFRAILGIHL